ncbi:MAG: hypothetical protein WBB34_17305 [Xanthobacteraceae bacterium]
MSSFELSGRSDCHAVAPSSVLEESQVECSEHQDDSYIHNKPFPEPISKEQDIHSNYDGCHQHDVKHHSYQSSHFSTLHDETRFRVRNVGSPYRQSTAACACAGQRIAQGRQDVTILGTGSKVPPNARRSLVSFVVKKPQIAGIPLFSLSLASAASFSKDGI